MKQRIIFAACLIAMQASLAQSTVQDCNRAFAQNTLPHTNCVKRVTGSVSKPPAAASQPAKPPVAAPPPAPRPPVTPPPAVKPPAAPAQPVRPPIVAPPPAPKPPVTPAPVPKPPIAQPQPIRPPVVPPPPAPKPPISTSYQLQVPSFVKTGESFAVTVFTQGGALSAQAAVVFSDGRASFVRRTGNAFIFKAVQEGSSRFELRDNTATGFRTVQSGQMQFQRSAAPPPPPPPPPPPISYRIQPPGKAIVGQPLSFSVAPANGAPLSSTIAVIIPNSMARFTGRNGNQFNFVALAPGAVAWELRESVNPGAKVLGSGQITIAKDIPPPPPPPPPPIGYRVQPPSGGTVGQPLSFSVASTNGAPLGASIAVVLPSNLAKFTGRSGNQFNFVALAPGAASWELRESVNPGARVLGNGQISIKPGIGESSKITSVSVRSPSAVVGQPITLLFTGQNLTNATAVTASDCDQSKKQLLSSNQIQLICTPRKGGDMRISWANQSGGALSTLGAVKIAVPENQTTSFAYRNVPAFNINPGGRGWCSPQCVEFVKANLGLPSGRAYAKEYWTNKHAGYSNYAQGDRRLPKPGDILVWAGALNAHMSICKEAKGCGHVAIVKSVDISKGTLVRVDANWDGKCAVRETPMTISGSATNGYRIGGSGSNHLLGWQSK